ncbi:hypothetical protein FHS83_003681 [Rhizomicrobium palustre]|uniref:Uncharacterized protein n=1 Tax=Rhizomicrobium palustre TaxID=189966 RepID=A0A846N413_9PROT|nr:hypothetical protein [Rhizomicrobium palustre]NIK90363.1 hypothetical protein [Rhizomicrobium palustre]
MRFLVPAFAMVLAASAAYAEEDLPTLLSEDGISDVKIGMKQDALERALHEKVLFNAYANGGCVAFTTKKLEAAGLGLLMFQKQLARVSVEYYSADTHPLAIKTAAGIGLGSSEEDVLKAYPGAKVKPNPADPSWHTVIWETADHSKGIVFETDGKKVKSMRAGLNPFIATPDGCS